MIAHRYMAGDECRQRRLALDCTAQHLASVMGVHRVGLSRYEHGQMAASKLFAGAANMTLTFMEMGLIPTRPDGAKSKAQRP